VTILASVKIKNVKSVLNSIERLFDSEIKKSRLYENIGHFSVERIQQETRKGRDLSQGGQKIKDTLESTKSIKKLIERGVITMRPSRPLFFRSQVSQVTQTGQLLDSLRADVNSSRGEITIEPTGNRSKTTYVWSKTGRPVKFLTDKEQIESNKNLASDLAKRGFTFLGMDKKGLKRIRRLVLDEIRRLIVKIKT
jgi:hypothetical protein